MSVSHPEQAQNVKDKLCNAMRPSTPMTGRCLGHASCIDSEGTSGISFIMCRSRVDELARLNEMPSMYSFVPRCEYSGAA
mmetsp:Transcript_45191/g.89565  ORF Transcript_45191/g.89565 Transcript_45191/m.89565 type:complete len:80 (-) Transcript_45191:5027-5266(-)